MTTPLHLSFLSSHSFSLFLFFFSFYFFFFLSLSFPHTSVFSFSRAMSYGYNFGSKLSWLMIFSTSKFFLYKKTKSYFYWKLLQKEKTHLICQVEYPAFSWYSFQPHVTNQKTIKEQAPCGFWSVLCIMIAKSNLQLIHSDNQITAAGLQKLDIISLLCGCKIFISTDIACYIL